MSRWSTSQSIDILQSFLTDNEELNASIVESLYTDVHSTIVECCKWIQAEDLESYMNSIHKLKQLLAYLGFSEASKHWGILLQDLKTQQTIEWAEHQITDFRNFAAQIQALNRK